MNTKPIINRNGSAIQATTFINLMGEAVGPRKSFIEKYAERANIDV